MSYRPNFTPIFLVYDNDSKLGSNFLGVFSSETETLNYINALENDKLNESFKERRPFKKGSYRIQKGVLNEPQSYKEIKLGMEQERQVLNDYDDYNDYWGNDYEY